MSELDNLSCALSIDLNIDETANPVRYHGSPEKNKDDEDEEVFDDSFKLQSKNSDSNPTSIKNNSSSFRNVNEKNNFAIPVRLFFQMLNIKKTL